MSLPRFATEAFTDFTVPANRKKMEKALALVESQLGREYDIIIGAERIKTEQKLYSYNPSNKDEVVGIVQKGSVAEAEKAIAAAYEAFQTWQYVKPDKRAQYLLKAVKVLRRRKFEYAAWMVFEVGKNWAEADADVAEAIDYLEFYAREMLRYAKPKPLVKYPGEKNEQVYIPLGVGVVVPPWNFPLAILLGMTTAAVVSGNNVVLKPSSESPVTGAKFMELWDEVGLPKGVINFLPGSGATIGDTLVGHPKTRFVAFTGSREVGTHIYELAAKVQPGQIWIKRAIAEMGGKDAIVVDETADLDAAVMAIVGSAFGYQGQKCSACSRTIIVDKVYDRLVNKIVAKTEMLSVGPAKENYPVGPVVSANAEQKILEYIETGKSEGRIVAGGTKAEGNGYYITPTVIADVDPHARIAQEEIFGPVLTVTKARDFDHALEIANGTEYGLTGSVYSKNRKRLQKAGQVFHCGNLYYNRKCTGALVGVHPFGGFNMSGTDSKAGGGDYLLLFLQAKVITEKVK